MNARTYSNTEFIDMEKEYSHIENVLIFCVGEDRPKNMPHKSQIQIGGGRRSILRGIPGLLSLSWGLGQEEERYKYYKDSSRDSNSFWL